MLPSEMMIWQPEFTDKTLSRKPGAVQPSRILTPHSDRPFVSSLDPSVAESASCEASPQPMRVTQEGPDGLSRYCPVRVICLEIPTLFHLTESSVNWLIKL